MEKVELEFPYAVKLLDVLNCLMDRNSASLDLADFGTRFSIDTLRQKLEEAILKM